jgi:hypothetical protein
MENAAVSLIFQPQLGHEIANRPATARGAGFEAER